MILPLYLIGMAFTWRLLLNSFLKELPPKDFIDFALAALGTLCLAGLWPGFVLVWPLWRSWRSRQFVISNKEKTP